MNRTLLLVFSWLVLSTAYAQEYRLFPKGQRAFFIDTTMGAGVSYDHRYLFDPTAVFQSENVVHDSVYTLNLEEFYDHTVNSLYNYTQMSNGDQLLETSAGTYTILRNALPGESWLGFKNLDDENKTIIYVEKTWEPVLGIPDSVKNYWIPGGRTLKISKTFGLFEVPVRGYAWQSDNSQLKLFSIASLQPQYNIRDFRNIVSFNKGYVYGGANEDALSSGRTFITRIEILDKTVRADSTIYEIASWKKSFPFIPMCGSSCDTIFERDTFTTVVKENFMTGHPSWAGIQGLDRRDFAYVKIDAGDTIFSIGDFGIMDGGKMYVSSSRTKGFVEHYEETPGPAPLAYIDFHIYCYYPVNTPDPACTEIEDLTPTYESINSETQLAVFYNPDTREINLSSEEISDAKISLVDVQGRVVYSTFPQSTEVKIPCEKANGFYQLLIESKNGYYRRGVAVW